MAILLKDLLVLLGGIILFHKLFVSWDLQGFHFSLIKVLMVYQDNRVLMVWKVKEEKMDFLVRLDQEVIQIALSFK